VTGDTKYAIFFARIRNSKTSYFQIIELKKSLKKHCFIDDLFQFSQNTGDKIELFEKLKRFF